MAKTSTERHMDWRNRVTLKARIFDDLNAERAARIRQAFPGDERPEVRAVVEFFANYPRCQHAPAKIEQEDWTWCLALVDADPYEVAAAKWAFAEITSFPSKIFDMGGKLQISTLEAERTVCDEVAEMRALGLWGRS